ncbi:MAG: guanylate kinase [Actinomycetota bacterium]
MIAGPSGVGKGTLVRRLRTMDPSLYVSVSVTTRRPRPEEHDGVDYFFIDEEGFDRLIAEDELLEWAEIFGHRSGTPQRPIRDVRREGRDAVLEIDVQGAAIVRRKVADPVLILLVPPSLEELARRLRTRATEDEDKLSRRLARAEWEMAQGDWFDHVIVNDELEGASAQVAAIIDASRHDPKDPSA